MSVENVAIAAILSQVADLLEIDGANIYRVRAYRNAARIIEDMPQSLAEMVARDEDLTEIPGIGETLANKIREIVQTGNLSMLEELNQEVPVELVQLLNVSGLGPKRVRALYDQLGVTTIEDLEKAAREHKIRELRGFGERMEQDILDNITGLGEDRQRLLLPAADRIAAGLVKYLSQGQEVQRVVVAGSYRRRQETVGDLDLLATSRDPHKTIERFVRYDQRAELVSRGDTRSTVILPAGVQVDLRVVGEESYGAALIYFTGSKAHNIVLRNMALVRSLKVSEYGVFQGDNRLAGATEEEIYALFGLAYIPPELREDRGEIDAAREGRLPKLITVEDIRGDLQTHTKASDGRATLEEMARAAQARGYEYLAITDHSPSVTIAGGLSPERLAEQIEQIDQLNERLDGLVVLKSSEVDILVDGSLDLPNDILERLDFVLGAVHSHFGLPSEQQTERLIRAMDNPRLSILGHPTGRLLGQRRPYAVDMERLLRAARERNCVVEVNAHPERLDLNDIHSKMAVELGVKLAISTDAHSPAELELMRFGVDQARRGWVEAKDVVNTYDLATLRRALRR